MLAELIIYKIHLNVTTEPLNKFKIIDNKIKKYIINYLKRSIITLWTKCTKRWKNGKTIPGEVSSKSTKKIGGKL